MTGPIVWKPNDYEHGWVAKVPPVTLSVGKSDQHGGDVFWQCHWQDDWKNGHADTVEEGKAAAIACAIHLCRNALKKLQGWT